MNSRKRSLLFNLLKIAISLGALAYVLLTLDWPTLVAAVRDVRWGYVGAAAVLVFAGIALRAVRWMALLNGLDIHVPLGRLVRLYFVGTFFNAFLPTGLGGDTIRAVELAHYTQKGPEAVGAVVVDRATGLWMMFVIGLIALPFSAGEIPPAMAWFVAAMSIVVVAGGWLVMGTRFVPWLGGKVRLPGQAKLERFYQAVGGCGLGALAQACGISLIFNVMTIQVNFLLARSLNVDLPMGTFFLYSPLQSTALLVPSVGGLGVGEVVYSLMYGTVDVNKELATAMSLARYVVQTVVPGVLGGVLYLIDGAMGLKKRIDPESGHGTQCP